jgi:hypothetical protein
MSRMVGPRAIPWLRWSVCLALSVTAVDLASAHGGGLNAEGCHTNRRTGDYHCHRAPRGATAYTPDSIAPRNGARSGLGGGSYASCAEARAAGAAPIRRGEPGYGAHLDRDQDGVACEQ